MDELHIAYSPIQSFPDKIVLDRVSIGNNDSDSVTATYFQQKRCYILITMLDDEHVIGHAECSKCHASVTLFNNYCPECGAKIVGRKIIKAYWNKNVKNEQNIPWE